MIKAERFALMLVFCLTATVGYSQDLNSEYGGPVHPVPRGEVPGMHVQLLKSGTEREYASSLGKGTKLFPDPRYRAPISPL